MFVENEQIVRENRFKMSYSILVIESMEYRVLGVDSESTERAESERVAQMSIIIFRILIGAVKQRVAMSAL